MSANNKFKKFDQAGSIGAYGIYSSRFSCWLNRSLFLLKMIIPQPVIKIIPGLLTNEDIRIKLALLNTTGKLLDIGCGNNRLVKSYRKIGGEGTGVDVYNWDDSILLVKDSSNLPFESGTFDTITFIACIGHIPNLLEVLKESRRLLADGGRVILTNLNPFISKIWHKYSFWDKDLHERGIKEGETLGFKVKDLLHLLKQAGFKVVKKENFSWGLNQLYICEKA